MGPVAAFPGINIAQEVCSIDIVTISWVNESLGYFHGIKGRALKMGLDLVVRRGAWWWEGLSCLGRSLTEVLQVHWSQRLSGERRGTQRETASSDICWMNWLNLLSVPPRTGEWNSFLTFHFLPHSQFPFCRKPRFQARVVCGASSLYTSHEGSRFAKSLQIQILTLPLSSSVSGGAITASDKSCCTLQRAQC